MIRQLFVVASVVALVGMHAAGDSGRRGTRGRRANPLPGTKLSVDQLKAQMFHVSAGKRLKGPWPNGARVAVGLSFDVDNATATLSTGNLDYEILSRGEYGAVDGLPRILRMLDRQQVPSSFFIPGRKRRAASRHGPG